MTSRRPTSPPSAGPAALVALATVLSLTVAGCGSDEPPRAARGPTDAATAGRGEGRAAGRPDRRPGGPRSSAPQGAVGPNAGSEPVDVTGAIDVLLAQRAAALTAHDRRAFRATLARGRELRTGQQAYFDNLAQLPLGTFGYRLVPASLVREGDDQWGVVEVTMELAGFDAMPVVTMDRFRFSPLRDGYVVSSTTDAAWERTNLPVQQPWDTEVVSVRQGSGVLGVFDGATTSEQAALVASVENGIADVSARVPYAWPRTAVFYALSDPRFLESFENLPGGDPEALDGVAFTVPAGTDPTSVAAVRFAVNPGVMAELGTVRRPDPGVDRLVRHELTHLAVGEHDDAAPLWLGEGIAEWVSAQALPPEQRQVPEAALSGARERTLVMPDDASFNDAESDVHYALSWWVCEWLAATYGPDAPYQLLDAFAQAPDLGEDRLTRQVLGVSMRQLARRASALMLSTFEPPPDNVTAGGGGPGRRPRGPQRRPRVGG